MQLELDNHMTNKAISPKDWNYWTEIYLPNPEEGFLPSDRYRKLWKDGKLQRIRKPQFSAALAKKAGAFESGFQQHYVMTIVESKMHTDNLIGQKSVILLIPYHMSDDHYLVTETEEMRLEAGGAYMFDQKHLHGLQYRNEKAGTAQSESACFLVVCYHNFE